MKPLEGVKVLDFSQFLSGPFCTMILCDMGAEVIKLERPPAGDTTRWSPPGRDGASTYYISCNRGKKSALMDLSDPRQKAIFLDMVKDADVLVENYKPGTMEKFGCGHEELLKINPRLVYTAISGFGQTGPWAKRPALDLVIQAASGLMSVTGEKGGDPQKVGTSISDITSGLYGCIGTLIALYAREKTGQGQYVDVSMLDSVVSVLESSIARYLLNGKIPKPIGNRHAAAAPFQPFKVKGGDQVFVCVISDEQWLRLCDCLHHPEWKEDPRFTSLDLRVAHADEMEEMMSAELANWTAEELCDTLEEGKVVYGQINNIEQVVNHPQIKAREMIIDVEFPGAGTLRTTGSPIRLSSMPHGTHYISKQLGSDTMELFGKYRTDEELHDIYDAVFPKVEETIAKKSLR